jgi:FkbM family methyltransferase
MRTLSKLVSAIAALRFVPQIADDVRAIRESQTSRQSNCDLQDMNKRLVASQIKAIRNSSGDSWFRVVLNHVPVWLPREGVVMMFHCLHELSDSDLVVFAETNHALWMRDRLTPGGVFLDVGAAIGQMSITTALTSDVDVYAFEPAKHQRELLIAGIARNNASGISVVEAAVSDERGSATFSEFALDESEAMAIAPETSSLASPHLKPGGTTYQVPVITLDDFCREHCLFGRRSVVKIDIEGFEVRALKGGIEYISATKPYLSIDIHPNPFGEGTTESAVRHELTALEYEFEKIDHVLLCTPATH